MQKTPIYLNDSMMPVYKFALIFALILSVSSIFVGTGYGIFTYVYSELSFSSALIEGLVLFLKGAAIAALIGFVGFMAFWKKYQITYLNCRQNNESKCDKIGFFRLV